MVLKQEGVSRTSVELVGDGVVVGLGRGAAVEPPGQVLAQQAIGGLVTAALRWAAWTGSRLSRRFVLGGWDRSPRHVVLAVTALLERSWHAHRTPASHV